MDSLKCLLQTKQVYERANKSLRGAGWEEHVLLLEAWRDFEPQNGDEKSLENVMQKMPQRVEKRQRIEADDGAEEGREEFFEYIFPEDEATKPNLKLAEMEDTAAEE
jgi:crooked neck